MLVLKSRSPNWKLANDWSPEDLSHDEVRSLLHVGEAVVENLTHQVFSSVKILTNKAQEVCGEVVTFVAIRGTEEQVREVIQMLTDNVLSPADGPITVNVRPSILVEGMWEVQVRDAKQVRARFLTDCAPTVIVDGPPKVKGRPIVSVTRQHKDRDDNLAMTVAGDAHEEPKCKWCGKFVSACVGGRVRGTGPRSRYSIELGACGSSKYHPTWPMDEILAAVDRMWQAVAPDLGIEERNAPAFMDYLGDQLSDSGMPEHVIREVSAEWSKRR